MIIWRFVGTLKRLNQPLLGHCRVHFVPVYLLNHILKMFLSLS
ncbi:MAG: hypothetical protein ACJAUA_001253, partial [Zhongshania aliphaticivorans]